jgi:hypothetical protein
MFSRNEDDRQFPEVPMLRISAAVAFVMSMNYCHAGVLSCTFSEPFLTLRFDSNTHEVVRASASSDGDRKPVTKVISRNARVERTIGEGEFETFELIDGKTIILTLTLDGHGTDGMSDRRFPFRASYGGQEGACDTKKYPRWDFDDIVDDLRLGH